MTTVCRVAPQGSVHVAAGDHPSPDQGLVVALDLAAFQGLYEVGVRTGCSGHGQTSGGVLVQAMDQPGPRQGFQGRIEMQQPVDQRSIGVARARVHHQPRRLVDNQQLGILEEDVQPHRLGFGVAVVALQDCFKPKLFSDPDMVIRLDVSTVHREISRPDPARQPAARKVRPNRRCDLVQTLIAAVRPDNENTRDHPAVVHF